MTALGAPKQFLRTGYGLTETGPLAWGVFDANLASHQDHVGKPVGPLYEGVKARFVENILEVKKPFSFVGYLLPSTNPGRSYCGLHLDEFRSGEEWFHTGDLARLKDGELVIQGRSKEIIIMNSRKISLQEIEESLTKTLARPGEAILAGIIPESTEEPNEKLIVAIATTHDTATSDSELRDIDRDIHMHLSQEFGLRASLISHINATDIPRTATGKVKRKELVHTLLTLRQRSKDTLSASPSGARLGAREKLIALLAEASNQKLQFEGAEKISHLGIDSLSLATIIGSVEREFGLTCQLDFYPSDPSVQQLWLLFTEPTINTQEIGTQDPKAAPACTPVPLDKVQEYSRAVHRRHIQRINLASKGIPMGEDRVILKFHTEQQGMPLILLSNCKADTLPRLGQELTDRPLYFLRTPNLPRKKVDREHLHHLHLEWIESVLPSLQMPFALSGICSGAFLAMELAKLLERRGTAPSLSVFIQWNPHWKQDSDYILQGKSSYHIQKDHHLADPSTCKRIKQELQLMTPNIVNILFSSQGYTEDGRYPDGKSPHDALTVLINKLPLSKAVH
jgi:acyl carrier protein